MIENNINGFCIIPNKLIQDESITDEALCLYVSLRSSCYMYDLMCSVTNLSSIYDRFCAKSSSQRKIIKDAIQLLIDKELIALHTDTLDNYKFDSSNLHTIFLVEFVKEYIESEYIKEDGFTRFPLKNVYNLINYCKDTPNGFLRYKFFKYYILIARRCSNIYNFGFVSMDNLKDIVGITNKTCSIYNEILSELDIIYYNNEYGYVDNKGLPKNFCTMFSHCNIPDEMNEILSKQDFENMVQEHINKKHLIKIDKKKANSKRSETMKKIWEERKNSLQSN